MIIIIKVAEVHFAFSSGQKKVVYRNRITRASFVLRAHVRRVLRASRSYAFNRFVARSMANSLIEMARGKCVFLVLLSSWCFMVETTASGMMV